MPDYYPDLDPFAHRDAEPDDDATGLAYNTAAHGDDLPDLNPTAHIYALCRVIVEHDSDGEPTGLTIHGADDYPLYYVDLVPDDRHGQPEWAFTVEYVRSLRPAAGRAPAGSDAHPDLRVPAGRQPDGDHKAGRDAVLRAAGGEPGAGAPAVPGGGAVPATLAYEHEYRPRPFRHAHRHAHPDDDGRARVNDALTDAHEHAHYPDDDGDHHPL